jgi:hypothetical protein
MAVIKTKIGPGASQSRRQKELAAFRAWLGECGVDADGYSDSELSDNLLQADVCGILPELCQVLPPATLTLAVNCDTEMLQRALMRAGGARFVTLRVGTTLSVAALVEQLVERLARPEQADAEAGAELLDVRPG